MSASARERDRDANESTPLLARRSSTSGPSSHRGHHHHHDHGPHQSPRLEAPAPYAQTTPDPQTQPPIAHAARILAALRTGHLPTSAQLVALSRLALNSDALAVDGGTVWQPQHGRGRIGTGKLSKQGEQVRLATRKAIEAVTALVEHRNPALRYKQPEDVWVAANTPGDGWQEFAWACTKSQIQIDPPSTRLPSAPPDAQATLRSSLSTLLHLLFASPSLRRLIADLALLLRDLVRLQLESVKQDGTVQEKTQESLAKVVDKAAEQAVGQEELVKHDLEGKEGIEGGRVGPATKPEQGAEQIRNRIMARFKEVVIEIQRTKTYQHAVQELLQLARDYIRRLVEENQPPVAVVVPEEPEPIATASSPGQTAPARNLAPQGIKPRAAVAQDPLEMVLPLLEPFTEKGPGSLSSLAPRFRLLFASPTSVAASELSSSTDGPDPEAEVMVRPPQEHLSLLAAEIDNFVSTALLEPGRLGSDASYRTLGAIQDRLDQLGQDCPVWASEVRSIASELVSAIASVADDPLLREAIEAMEELMKAMGRWSAGLAEVLTRTATGGGVGLASAVWGDVVEWLAPRVMGVLSEIPLPRLEFATENIAIALEPPSLISTSFVPARVTWHQSSDLTYSPSSGDSTLALPLSASHPASSSSLSSSSDRMTYTAKSVLSIEGIQLEVLDVGYFASYKTGIPCFGDITERGLLDLHFGVDPVPPTDPSVSPRGEGLAFDLAFSTSGSGDEALTAPLFAVDHSRTVVRLRDFRFEPHQSSHPWLMWFFRPLLRKAVQAVLEKEMKEKVLEAGAEWIARKGGEVRKRRRERAREEAEEGETEPEPWSREAVWRWIRAGWDVFVGQDGGAQESASIPETTEEHPDRPFHLHVTPRGVAADLDNLEATVGLGTEGVVIPAGEAEIPLPEGHAPKKGVVQAARDEVAHEVQEGRDAARAGVDALGGMMEARQEWHAAVPASGVTWRSTAFDV